MEWFAAWWNEYIRFSLIWIFLLGIVVLTYRIRDRWVEMWGISAANKSRDMISDPKFDDVGFWRACLAVLVPYWVWMIGLGVPATILDMMFWQP